MASPLAALAGSWRGTGSGEFPSMEPFDYEEGVTFSDVGEPILVYRQHAWVPGGDELLHLETGLWRTDDDGNLAVTIALPRVTEVSEGTIRDGSIELVATSVSRAQGGAELVEVHRAYAIAGDTISYEIAMATEGVPSLTHHLAGTLHRVPGDEGLPQPAVTGPEPRMG